MAKRNAPVSATIFAYQVGFGDCFLLRFEYANQNRKHVLIDFGTTGLPKDMEDRTLKSVADKIAIECGGVLDAVVATHRHADHISGFATAKNGKGPGDVIKALQPALVLQPWTEEPSLAVNAKGPQAASVAFAKALSSMNAVAERSVRQLQGSPKAFESVKAQLGFIGQDNIANLSAIKNLQTMGRTNVYAYCGSNAGLADILPGVKVRVLGPPTVEQSDKIRKQRARDPNDFWQLQLKKLAAHDGKATGSEKMLQLFPGHPFESGGKLPRSVRWMSRRLREGNAENALQVVRMLDQQMNNTSLILLFEAGNKKLLFPGDAQFENWDYALSQPEISELLTQVDVYKVGHHGSLNATPKRMWNALAKKSKTKGGSRLKTVLSTMDGKHGSVASHTEVPRATLLKALKSDSELHSTQDLHDDEPCKIVSINLTD